MNVTDKLYVVRVFWLFKRKYVADKTEGKELIEKVSW